MKPLYRLIATIFLIGAVGCGNNNPEEGGGPDEVGSKLQKTFLDASIKDSYMVAYYTGNVSTVSSEFYFDMDRYQLAMNLQNKELVLQGESIDNYMKITYDKVLSALKIIDTECGVVIDYKKNGLPKTVTLNTKVVRAANGYVWLWDAKSKKGVVMPLSTNIN